MEEPEMWVGVDVAKDEPVVAVHGQSACQHIPNDANAIRSWLGSLPSQFLVAVESTGRYHPLVITLASAMGIKAFVLNARDVYFYAKALGARAQTDALDAHVIARYLAEHHAQLRVWQTPSAVLCQLQRLLAQRSMAVTKQVALCELSLVDKNHRTFAGLLASLALGG